MRVMDLPPGLQAWCVIVCVMLGAVFGSFLHCAAWRIAREQLPMLRSPLVNAVQMVKQVILPLMYLLLLLNSL